MEATPPPPARALPHDDFPPDGRRRVVVEGVRPAVDSGRFPVKRALGEAIEVTADVFADGHDHVRAALRVRTPSGTSFEEPMTALVNDRFAASFVPDELGRYEYTVTGWVDHFGSWREAAERKLTAAQDVSIDLEIGARMLESVAATAPRALASEALAAADRLRRADPESVLEDDALADAIADHDRREDTVLFPHLLDVDRPLATFGAWYEMFPRSASPEPGRAGTFADVEARLAYVAGMGFDVLYLPPIHPIGLSHRKGKNNALTARNDDVGSPWAIGGPEGGHKAIDPALGTPDDFRRLVKAADAQGLEIALDIAFQCSPDHPYAKEHPEWFRRRPDGSIQCAENPPKKYEDILPFDFETSEWRALWRELRSVFDFWISQGVKVFRVDNPHTKSFPFWEWCVSGLRGDHPDVVLLSEAFTRPRVMERLAKIGFNQSYTYFAWRSSAWELREYFEELVGTEAVEYLRPNVWPNTPDILTAYLQENGRPAFVIRAVLAATLASAYGVYGPVFELAEGRPRESGSEEYLDSEKYEVRCWDLEQAHSLRPLLARLNAIRRAHGAFHSNRTLRFHDTDNAQLLCYSKIDPATEDAVLCVVNVDPRNPQDGHVHLDLDALGLADADFTVRDLLGGGSYTWHGPQNWVRLDPHTLPAHVFAIEQP